MPATLFSAHDLKPELLSSYFRSIPQLEEKKQIIRNWQKAIESGKVHKSKEEQIKSEFLDKFFGHVLGYAYESHEADWNLEKEFKSISDNKKPDAALGFFNQQGKADVRCVVEVKGALTNLDKKQNRADFTGSAVDQAFAYVPRMPGKCEWVIVTNMIEIRLYSRIDIGRYESFLIPELLQPAHLARFFFLLSYQQLFLEKNDSKIDQIFYHRVAEQKVIEKEFYHRYHELRVALFNSLRQQHTAIAPKKLFGLTQKLLDRLLFICFVRDRDLLDANRFLSDVQLTAKRSFRKKKEAIWTEMKYFFTALNEGLSESERDIPQFNGGLFKEDEDLNSLHVHDGQLTEIIRFVSSYNFDSQLDVNILGHIFEQSISDIEAFQQSFDGEQENHTNKRKKDGIFYTPDYITRYMVKEAVGGWLDDRKKEILQDLQLQVLPTLSAEEIENAITSPTAQVQATLTFLERYREQLKKIKVVDPACGSGAFLNAVFDYLWQEWHVLTKEWNQLTRPWKDQLRDLSLNEPLEVYHGIDEWKIKKSIVANNIYGVDLNPESVEISKLSLWLKTANRKETLADLSANIKQGNSLIDAPTVAGEDAFDWHHAFAEIMKSGGFDVVVGNPPYVPTELIKLEERTFYRNVFPFLDRKYDISILFIAGCLKILHNKGKLTFISSTTWQTGENYNALRKYLFTNYGLRKIVNLPFDVFEAAYVETCIYLFTKNPSTSYEIFVFPKKAQVSDLNNLIFSSVAVSDLGAEMKLVSPSVLNINESVSKVKTISLGEISKSTQGLAGNKFQRRTENFHGSFPFLEQGQLLRYRLAIEKFSYASLDDYKSLVDYYEAKPKILIRRIISRQDRLNVAYTEDRLLFTKDINPFIITDSRFNCKYILSLLASKLISYLYLNRSSIAVKDDFRQTTLTELRNLRIPIIDRKNQRPLVTLAEKMLALHQSIAERAQKFIDLLRANFVFEPTAKLKKWYTLEFIDVLAELEKGGLRLPPKKQSEWLELFKTEKENLKHTQAEIDKTDREIDQHVYALYELTPEEIAVVERG